MKFYLLIYCLLNALLALNAFPHLDISPSVINGFEIDARHACLIFAPSASDPSLGAFGAGNIISNRHILTAASLLNGAGNLIIGYGSSTAGASMEQKTTNTFIIHPQYNATTQENNIAIIFLPVANPFDLSVDAVTPIDLPANSIERPADGTKGISAGWGFTDEGQSATSQTLYAAALEVIPLVNCTSRFNLTLDTEFCVSRDESKGESTSSNLCPGDNGAGFFTPGESDSGNDEASTKNEEDGSAPVPSNEESDPPPPPANGKRTLIGIASIIGDGATCAVSNNIGFTNVAMYITWIQDITGITPAPPPAA